MHLFNSIDLLSIDSSLNALASSFVPSKTNDFHGCFGFGLEIEFEFNIDECDFNFDSETWI